MIKAFSLMEIIVSVVILSFVMITLIETKENNIFLLSKSNERNNIEEKMLLAIDFNTEFLNTQEDILLSTKYNFENKDIQRVLDDLKIEIRQEYDKNKSIKLDEYNINLNIDTFYKEFGLKNDHFKKKFYTFGINLK